MQYSGASLAVVADDLTGACDTACQFALYGFRPMVLCSPETALFSQSSLIVINTDSRRHDARSAYQKVTESAQLLLREQYLPVYKKMDSTLKGNWAPELAAMVRTVQPELVVVAPAFPAWDRTTVDGTQCYQGKPVPETRTSGLASTETRAGQVFPNLFQVLQSQFGKRVCLFKRSAYKKGPAALAKQIETALFRGYAIQVFDAVHDDDLKTIVMAGCHLENRVLWTGSAGLARYLPLGWGCSPKPHVQGFERRPEPVLVINGSLNPMNAEQIHHLQQARSAPALWIEDEDSENSANTQAKVGEVLNLLQGGMESVVSVRLNKPIRSAAQLQRLQDALQFAALQCLHSRKLAGTVLVGGETAMKLYRKVSAAALRIDGEVQPGVPYGLWIGGLLDGQALVTKAGGFGQPDTLVKAVAFLKGE
jgi:uncharacterized protein YgbK (DUF1537 family)